MTKKDNIAKENKGVIVVIHSYAKGNFIRVRNITRFLDTLMIYAVVENKVLDETKPSIVIEVNILDEEQNFIISKIKEYVEKSTMKDVKLSIKDTDMPTFGDMAKSFGAALFQTGKDFISGNKVMATERVQTQRLDTCLNCEYFNHESYTCNKCSCKMRYKSALLSSTCPMDKWAE